MLSYLPGVIILDTTLNWFFESTIPVAMIAIAWMVFFVFAGYRMSSFPCPRCGKQFFYKFPIHNPLAQRCMHCNWPKWKPQKTGEPVQTDSN